MRHRPRPLHRTVRGSARRTAVSSPSRPPRPTSHGGPRMATAPRTRPLGHVGHVRRASASCSALGCLPAPKHRAARRPCGGRPRAGAVVLETPRRPGVVRVRIWTGEQRHGLMAGWTDSTERGAAGRAAAVPFRTGLWLVSGFVVTGSAMRWRDPPTWVNGRSTVY